MQAPGGWEVQPAEPPDAGSQGPPRMKSGPICSFLLEKPVSSAGKHNGREPRNHQRASSLRPLRQKAYKTYSQSPSPGVGRAGLNSN